MDEISPDSGIGSSCAAKTPEKEKEKDGNEKEEKKMMRRKPLEKKRKYRGQMKTTCHRRWKTTKKKTNIDKTLMIET